MEPVNDTLRTTNSQVPTGTPPQLPAIHDMELGRAIEAMLAGVQHPHSLNTEIRTLVQSYVGKPGSVPHDIPSERRRAFLDEVAQMASQPVPKFITDPEHTLTLFPNKYASEKEEWTGTLDQLAEHIQSTTGEHKDCLPFFKMAIFGDAPTDKNCLRHDANVKWITGVEGDYDGGDGPAITFDDAVSRLRSAGVKGLVYTTASNTDEKPRWRALCPASEKLPHGERDALMGRLSGIFDGKFAGESWTHSQSYYYGNVTGRPAVRVEVVEGEYIDCRPDLPEIAKPGSERAKVRVRPAGEPVTGTSISVEQLRAMGKAAEAGCAGLHHNDLILAIWGVMRIAVDGDEDGAIREEVARAIWDANTGSESKNDAKFVALLTDEPRYDADGTLVGPGTFVMYAQQGGYARPQTDPATKYGQFAAEHFAGRPAPSGDAVAIPEGEISCIAASEDDLAIGFAMRHGERLRYVDERGQWTAFDGRCWKPAPTPAVWNLLRTGLREYAAGLTGDTWSEHKRRQLVSRSTISNVEALARGDLLIPAAAFDADPWLLNTPAGIVDLHTGELHRPAPEAYCTKMVAFAPGGECPRWTQFLAEITGDDVELQRYLQRLIGYSLIGQVFEHVLVFLYGTGANGKSTFLNTITAMLGTYATVAAIDTFTETRNERHPTDMAHLQGRGS